MIRLLFLFHFLTACGFISNAQTLNDSIKTDTLYSDSIVCDSIAPLSVDFPLSKREKFLKSRNSKYIIPSALIFYGITTRLVEEVKNLDYEVNDEISAKFDTRFYIDDYLQLASGASIYGLSICGIKAKNSYRDRTFVLLTSGLMTATTVQLSKALTNITRPDKSNDHSFPSGHTATAFLGAHILYKEYKDASVWIPIAGYTSATATGVMRMLNKKHWLSDVITGAGVAMIYVEVSYLLLPHFQNLMGDNKNKKVLALAPSYNGKEVSLNFALQF